MKCPHCLVEFHEDWSQVWLWNGMRGDALGIRGVGVLRLSSLLKGSSSHSRYRRERPRNDFSEGTGSVCPSIGR